jgi:F-type H+-transporting ATPase subunit gamma
VASVVEIKNRIASVSSIMKVTKVMHMISVSKLNKSRGIRGYYDSVRDEFGVLVKNVLDNFADSYMLDTFFRKKRSKLIIVLSSDRGLCGNVNSSVFKTFRNEVEKAISEYESVYVLPVGKKASVFVGRNRVNLSNLYSNLEFVGVENAFHSESFDVNVLNEISSFVNDFYKNKSCDISVVYSHFKNVITSEPVVSDVFASFKVDDSSVGYSEYYNIYDSQSVLEGVMSLYLSSVLKSFYFDHMTSVYSNRMKAMDNATKNSQELSFQLKLSYNKIRQAMITNELSDIVSGSEATAV